MRNLVPFVLLGTISIVSGCAVSITGTPGSGIAATQDRTGETFHAISVSGTSSVNVTVGGETSVVVSGDDNLLAMITTKVVNGELQVSTNGSYSTNIGLAVDVSVPSLDSVTVSGVGDLTATNIQSPTMKVDVSGVGDAELSGVVDVLEVNVSGTGDADLQNLIAKNVTVEASGVGDANVHASASVDATASGVGDVEVFGSPAEVKQSASGIGDVVVK